MKYNKDAYSLYSDFSRKLRLLCDESYSSIREGIAKNKSAKIKYAKFLESPEMETTSEIVKYYKESLKNKEGMWLTLNSNFIYSFALFENFISEIVKLSFRKNKKSQEKYIEYFETFAEKRFEDGDKKYFRMLKNKKAMIDNYDELPSPVSLCKEMFNMNTDDKLYKGYFFRFIEARERRNLLIHRGVIADKRYFDSVKSSLGKWKQQADKFLKEEILTKELLLPINKDKPDKFDLSISSRYTVHSFNTLFFMGSIIFLKAFKLSKSEIKENNSYTSNIMHDTMVLAYDENIPILYVAMDVWIYYFEQIANKNWDNFSDFDKVNKLLTLDLIYKKSKITASPHVKSTIITILKSISDENFREMVIAHNNNDVKTLLRFSKILKLKQSDFENFFIFRKFQKTTRVKNYFKKVG